MILLLINCSSICFGRKDARNMLRNNWLTIKSLIVASSWSHIYLVIKDARSLKHKIGFSVKQIRVNDCETINSLTYYQAFEFSAMFFNKFTFLFQNKINNLTLSRSRSIVACLVKWFSHTLCNLTTL